MHRPGLTRVFATISFLAAASAVSAAPIFESGFSDPALPSGGFEEVAAGSTIGPWAVGGGGVDWIGTWWQSADGDGASVDLNRRAPGSVSASIPTVAGTSYFVTFAMSGNVDTFVWDPDDTIKRLDVSAAGKTLTYNFDLANALGPGMPATHADMGWVVYSFSFTATSSSTLLTFSSLSPNMWGPALDRVVVGEIPEPGTMLLLGAGLAGLFWFRRRV